MNKKFLLACIATACVLIGAVSAFGYSVAQAEKQSDLGYDLSAYKITKMHIEGDMHVVGTQGGELFAFGAAGETLWNIGKPYETAVYDIASHGGTVYAAYANGRVLGFTTQAATEYTQAVSSGEDERAAKAAFMEQTTQYYADCAFDTSGNVRNTQLLLSAGGDILYVRGVFSELRNKNRIYRYETAGGGRFVEPVAQVDAITAAISGMALDDDGTLWWTTRGEIRNKKGEAFADAEETLRAVSFADGYIYAIGETNTLYRVDIADASEMRYWKLDAAFSGDLVYSTGENFVGKINNGGVAIVDTSKHAVTVSMGASDKANLIMWSDDKFVLRDESDPENPTVMYYTAAMASRVELFSALRWVFLSLSFVLLVAVLYFGFGMRDDYRERIHAKIKSFFKALWKHKAVYLCLLIPLALLIVFYYIPIFFGFGLSFFDYIPGVKAVPVGFANFSAVLTSPAFWKAAGTMLVFLLADLVKALLPPILLAEMIFAVRSKRFSLWVRILLFLPGILPGVATVLVWSEGIFGASNNSLVNAFIGIFVPGFVKNWVYSASQATAVSTLIAFGFPWIGSYLIFYGAIAGINVSTFEAAKLDGCKWGKRILSIDIPLILPQIKYIFVTSFIASVQNYTSIYVLHGVNGQIQTPALMMYREIVGANYGVASAMGVIIFLFLSIATFLNFRMQSDKS